MANINTEIDEIVIKGVTYVPKGSIQQAKVNTDGLKYVICRGYYCGVHAGYLKVHDGNYVELVNTRRLWSWQCKEGISLSALSQNGLAANHAIPAATDEIWLGDVYEVLPCTETAADSIIKAPVKQQS